MPYTPAQRRLFHEVAENPDAARRHGMSRGEGRKLAHEADEMAREGKEKRSAQHPGGDTDAENGEPAMRRAKHASVGFVDLTPIFGSCS